MASTVADRSERKTTGTSGYETKKESVIMEPGNVFIMAVGSTEELDVHLRGEKFTRSFFWGRIEIE